MKRKKSNGLILCSLLSLTLLGGGASADSPSKPWPTHAPEATPYVRVFDSETAPPRPEGGPVQYGSVEELWDSIKTRFGCFYAKNDELDMFRALPQNEPFSFVPHSPRDELDEGEAMRTARLFDALEGCEARVIAQHTLFEGLDDWGYLTVVTMSPARFFELSEETG
jgi:hypothetical protein